MLSKTFASAVQGVSAQTITIEVNAGGVPQQGKQFLFMVGLPDSAVREGFQRIGAAMKTRTPAFSRSLCWTSLHRYSIAIRKASHWIAETTTMWPFLWLRTTVTAMSTSRAPTRSSIPSTDAARAMWTPGPAPPTTTAATAPPSRGHIPSPTTMHLSFSSYAQTT